MLKAVSVLIYCVLLVIQLNCAVVVNVLNFEVLINRNVILMYVVVVKIYCLKVYLSYTMSCLVPQLYRNNNSSVSYWFICRFGRQKQTFCFPLPEFRHNYTLGERCFFEHILIYILILSFLSLFRLITQQQPRYKLVELFIFVKGCLH